MGGTSQNSRMAGTAGCTVLRSLAMPPALCGWMSGPLGRLYRRRGGHHQAGSNDRRSLSRSLLQRPEQRGIAVGDVRTSSGRKSPFRSDRRGPFLIEPPRVVDFWPQPVAGAIAPALRDAARGRRSPTPATAHTGALHHPLRFRWRGSSGCAGRIARAVSGIVSWGGRTSAVSTSGIGPHGASTSITSGGAWAPRDAPAVIVGAPRRPTPRPRTERPGPSGRPAAARRAPAQCGPRKRWMC